MKSPFAEDFRAPQAEGSPTNLRRTTCGLRELDEQRVGSLSPVSVCTEHSILGLDSFAFPSRFAPSFANVDGPLWAFFFLLRLFFHFQHTDELYGSQYRRLFFSGTTLCLVRSNSRSSRRLLFFLVLHYN